MMMVMMIEMVTVMVMRISRGRRRRGRRRRVAVLLRVDDQLHPVGWNNMSHVAGTGTSETRHGI